MMIEIQQPELEALIHERMMSGAFRSVEEVLIQALKSSTARAPIAAPVAPRTVQDAIESIRKLRKGNSLAGLNLKDLIHEGHKY